MLEEAPIFTVTFPEDSSDFLIDKPGLFHEHVIDFISLRLSGNFESNDPEDNILCFFKVKNAEANHMEARLEPEGYEKSLSTCLTYFTENEEYEKCNRIIELQQKLNNLPS